MATTLHQQLKQHYVRDEGRHEVTVSGYRIDAVDARQRLIEIQCASLAAIRRKVGCLLETHRVIVAKPLASRKLIVKKAAPDGQVISSRFSPLRQTLMHIFQDLVHFARIFPHPGLRLDVLLTEQHEIRIAAPTRRRRWQKQYFVHDRLLADVREHLRLTTPDELWEALQLSVPERFTTSELAEASAAPRWLCQKAAYCFREMQFFDVCDKRGNAVVYRLARRPGRMVRRARRPRTA